jgi:hypothetical protein
MIAFLFNNQIKKLLQIQGFTNTKLLSKFFFYHRTGEPERRLYDRHFILALIAATNFVRCRISRSFYYFFISFDTDIS